jgi:hypothetical protein
MRGRKRLSRREEEEDGKNTVRVAKGLSPLRIRVSPLAWERRPFSLMEGAPTAFGEERRISRKRVADFSVL